MIIVTGGAGFIGRNIILGLNHLGRNDILVVDDLSDGIKFKNLVNLDIKDYLDKDQFLLDLAANKIKNIDVIFHQGACSSTTEWDGKYMMQNNYEYSKILFNYCTEHCIPFLYASSAAVYGDGVNGFEEDENFEHPLNVYGYSKLLFDQYVLKNSHKHTAPVCGLRYFNVYGSGEAHKGSMASVAYHLNTQILNGEKPKLFLGSERFKRDFIYIDDIVKINLWAWQNKISGVYNCGTGHAQSFAEVGLAVLEYHGLTEIEWIPFPDHLKGKYQEFTEASIKKLEDAGYKEGFLTVKQGVKSYLTKLNNK